jgi:alkylated DNA repair dioxygenase AlkB
MDAPVTYLADFYRRLGDPDEMFRRLRDELPWERRPDTPRFEHYSNDTDVPYTYGAGPNARTYFPQPWHPLILEVRDALHIELGTDLDVCFSNRYVGARDWLGWHADDSPEMDPDAEIVTVSFGEVRSIQFRPNGGTAADVETLWLGHGSAAVMAAGMQAGWKHRIPKSSRQGGNRVSLTFRRYRDPALVGASA